MSIKIATLKTEGFVLGEDRIIKINPASVIYVAEDASNSNYTEIGLVSGSMHTITDNCMSFDDVLKAIGWEQS